MKYKVKYYDVCCDEVSTVKSSLDFLVRGNKMSCLEGTIVFILK